MAVIVYHFFLQAEDGIRDPLVTGVQTCALPISPPPEPIWSPGPAPNKPPSTPAAPAPARTWSRSSATAWRCPPAGGKPAVTPVEWGVLVERLGHIYPAQVLPAETVNAWYDELAEFPADQVWQAMRRLIRTRPRWLFDAIANLYDALAELDRERRAMAAQERAAQQRPVRRQHGAPCPPEFDSAVAVLKHRLAGGLDAVSANETIQAL